MPYKRRALSIFLLSTIGLSTISINIGSEAPNVPDAAEVYYKKGTYVNSPIRRGNRTHQSITLEECTVSTLDATCYQSDDKLEVISFKNSKINFSTLMGVLGQSCTHLSSIDFRGTKDLSLPSGAQALTIERFVQIAHPDLLGLINSNDKFDIKIAKPTDAQSAFTLLEVRASLLDILIKQKLEASQRGGVVSSVTGVVRGLFSRPSVAAATSTHQEEEEEDFNQLEDDSALDNTQSLGRSDGLTSATLAAGGDDLAAASAAPAVTAGTSSTSRGGDVSTLDGAQTLRRTDSFTSAVTAGISPTIGGESGDSLIRTAHAPTVSAETTAGSSLPSTSSSRASANQQSTSIPKRKGK